MCCAVSFYLCIFGDILSDLLFPKISFCFQVYKRHQIATLFLTYSAMLQFLENPNLLYKLVHHSRLRSHFSFVQIHRVKFILITWRFPTFWDVSACKG